MLDRRVAGREGLNTSFWRFLTVCGMQADMESDGHDEQPALPSESARRHHQLRSDGHALRASHQIRQRGRRVSHLLAIDAGQCVLLWILCC